MKAKVGSEIVRKNDSQVIARVHAGQTAFQKQLNVWNVGCPRRLTADAVQEEAPGVQVSQV